MITSSPNPTTKVTPAEFCAMVERANLRHPAGAHALAKALLRDATEFELVDPHQRTLRISLEEKNIRVSFDHTAWHQQTLDAPSYVLTGYSVEAPGREVRKNPSKLNEAPKCRPMHTSELLAELAQNLKDFSDAFKTGRR